MNLDENSKAFLDQFEDTITEQINQELVRLELVTRGLESGLTKKTYDALYETAGYAYQAALNNGFDDVQAFEMAKKSIGY